MTKPAGTPTDPNDAQAKAKAAADAAADSAKKGAATLMDKIMAFFKKLKGGS
jgi:hypothetical protein